MSKIKVEMVGNSRGVKGGEVVEVDKAAAERLIKNHHAVSVTKAGEQEIHSS